MIGPDPHPKLDRDRLFAILLAFALSGVTATGLFLLVRGFILGLLQ